MDGVPDRDAIFVERLRRNGAILIGKTNVPEFGLGSQSYSFGVTRKRVCADKDGGRQQRCGGGIGAAHAAGCGRQRF